MEFDIEKSYCTQCEITGVYRDSRGENPNRFLFLYRKNEIKYSENGNEFEVAVETRDFTKELAIKAAWQKILCRRFSTKVKNGAVKQGGFWLKSPSLHHSRRCTAVCMPQA